ncbi:hypothetical protein EV178_003157 [Coemansia sp. RSA 1646]|nr:hypothetical protein EV178_003157 [Coemansia sp. RSA 1646]
MTKNDFNVATTLFTVGYLSLEVFSNFVLKRVVVSKLLPTLGRWQWVFILEGILTVVVSLFGHHILQDYSEKCIFLNDDDREFIVSYKKKEGSFEESQQLSLSDTKRALFDWQLWVMSFASFTMCSLWVELINELRFVPAQSQAMSALPPVFGAIAILLAGHIVKLRGSHWLAGVLALGIALVGRVVMAVTLNIPAQIIGLCLVGTDRFSGLGILSGWNITANS